MAVCDERAGRVVLKLLEEVGLRGKQLLHALKLVHLRTDAAGIVQEWSPAAADATELVEFTLYVPSVDLLVASQMVIEMPPTGDVIPVAQFYPTQIHRTYAALLRSEEHTSELQSP